jgi:hypothetical protein
MEINIAGLVLYQTNQNNKIKLTVIDKDSIKKIKNVLKYTPEGYRIPVQGDTYQIVINGKTKITSEIGKESIECLPTLIGWRLTGKVKIKTYNFKSRYGDNLNNTITGCTLVCNQIHLGSTTE